MLTVSQVGGMNPLKKGSLGMTFNCICRVWSNTPLLLLPGSFWSGVVIPVWVQSIGQLDLFKNY